MGVDTSNAAVKADRKVAAAAAGRRGNYEVTGFGRTRRSRVPKAVGRLVTLLCAPFTFLWKCRGRLRACMGRAGQPDPRKAAR
jgi:hypothetical protein